jgi:3'(2'), 5'-bisphosphate nucleotidase
MDLPDFSMRNEEEDVNSILGGRNHPSALDAGRWDEIALSLAKAVLAAGPAVMEEYERGCEVASKDDGSPVTSADRRAEAVICECLASLIPALPVCAEESMSAGAQPEIADRFLLVDPLDGTREFLARNGEFTINAALIDRGVPVAGAVYAPAIHQLWVGGETAFTCDAPVGADLPDEKSRRQIRARRAPERLVALVSRSHLDAQSDAFLKRLSISESLSAGSSLKFCLIAEGRGDVYPRFAPTMEWDTAAGDAVLRAAGGIVLDPEGRALSYGKADSGLRNGSFIAWGDAEAARTLGC